MPPIFFLDVGVSSDSPFYPSQAGIFANGKILRLDSPNQPPNGSNDIWSISCRKSLVTGLSAPDGIDVDPSANRMYWTNMGADVNDMDGSLMSFTLDGSDKKVLLGGADGVFTTPMQLGRPSAKT
ncbi:hypothetical protein B0H65DRAFT_553342 [Neurospora tetraspora]|uniref:Uncharacterized protein n=1 Tax=Neurospora tetraspora TaxID=94610 RepID=A0AAE0MKG7_9PEZI|nr:hypothetical protein B0H65DRAFT_553342 [Neurospora tetraspora]